MCASFVIFKYKKNQTLTYVNSGLDGEILRGAFFLRIRDVQTDYPFSEVQTFFKELDSAY
jgi:hypothetical protein